MWRHCNCLLAFVLAIATSSAWAVGGRIPIPFSSPVTTPIVINAPGTYVLTRNLVATGSGPVIEIASTDVSLDLNGWSLTVASGSEGIRVSSGASASIRNGTVVGGFRGIVADISSDVVLEDLTVRGTSERGIYLFQTETFAVRRCRIEDTGGSGIAAEGTQGQGTIEQNLLRRVATGISLASGGSAEVTDNQIREVLGGIGIHLSGFEGALVSENTIENVASGEGIRAFFAPGSVVTGNVVANVTDTHGIYVTGGSDGCRVSGNVITNVGDIGLFVDGADGLLVENVVRGSAGAGVKIRGHRMHVEGNLMNSNGLWGLHLNGSSTNNVVRRNTARNNSGNECDGVLNADYCNEGTGNVSQGDNWMPFSL